MTSSTHFSPLTSTNLRIVLNYTMVSTLPANDKSLKIIACTSMKTEEPIFKKILKEENHDAIVVNSNSC